MADTSDIVLEFLRDDDCLRGIGRMMRGVYRRARYLIEEDDFLQEVLLQALRGRYSFRGSTRGEFLAWMHGIARLCRARLIHQALRARMLPEEHSLDAMDAAPEEQLSIHEVLVALERLLGKMNPLEAAIIRARHLDELSFRQIAQIVEMSESHVRQIHHRTLKRLRGLLPRELR